MVVALPIEENAKLGPQPKAKKNQPVNPPVANYVPPDPAVRHVTQAKPLVINQRDVEHPTVTPSIPQKQLDVLQATGFIGNGVDDFNTQVARIWKTYTTQNGGTPPTPGLVMDLLRSPHSYDPNAIEKIGRLRTRRRTSLLAWSDPRYSTTPSWTGESRRW